MVCPWGVQHRDWRTDRKAPESTAILMLPSRPAAGFAGPEGLLFRFRDKAVGGVRVESHGEAQACQAHAWPPRPRTSRRSRSQAPPAAAPLPRRAATGCRTSRPPHRSPNGIRVRRTSPPRLHLLQRVNDLRFAVLSNRHRSSPFSVRNHIPFRAVLGEQVSEGRLGTLLIQISFSLATLGNHGGRR